MCVDSFINQPETQEADIRPIVDHISEHKHACIQQINLKREDLELYI